MRARRVLLAVGLIAASPLIVAVVLLPLIAIAAIVLGLWVGSSTTVFERSPSPNGRYEARVEFSDCGAACSFSRDVIVRRVGVPFSDCAALTVDGEWPLSLQWADNTHLMIGDPAPPTERRSKSESCGTVDIKVEPKG